MNTTSLIAADNSFALLALLGSTVAIALYAERWRWAQTLSAPLLILFTTLTLANIGVMPGSAPAYTAINSILVPMAIPLLLFRADLKQVFTETGALAKLFVLAAAGTVLGAIIGSALIDIGADENQITGMMAASLIGGSMNFVASAEALGFNDQARYIAALSADVAGALLFLGLLMALPASAMIRRWLPSRFPIQGSSTTSDEHNREQVSLKGMALALAASAVVCGLAQWLAGAVGAPRFFILFVTLLALVVANVMKPLVAGMDGEITLGTLFMYLFFAALGTGADLVTVFDSALPMMALVAIMLVVHLTVMVVVGRWLKADLAEVMIASNACILGPATAAALAASRGWRELVPAGTLVGVLGYAMGTFIGVAIAGFLAT